MSGMPIRPSVAILSAAVFGSVIVGEGRDYSEAAPVQEPLPAGHSTAPKRFPEPSIWIPAGKNVYELDRDPCNLRWSEVSAQTPEEGHTLDPPYREAN